jgi:hypothetical protein
MSNGFGEESMKFVSSHLWRFLCISYFHKDPLFSMGSAMCHSMIGSTWLVQDMSFVI